MLSIISHERMFVMQCVAYVYVYADHLTINRSTSYFAKVVANGHF